MSYKAMELWRFIQTVAESVHQELEAPAEDTDGA